MLPWEAGGSALENVTLNPENHPDLAGRHLSISALPVKELGGFGPGARPGSDREKPCSTGAVVTFFGTVRGSEGSTKIRGIEYTPYPPMVEAEMARMDEEGRERFGDHPLYIHHTTGFVAQGDPSVVIRVALPHSAEAFEACQWYLGRIKTRIPIWKRPITQ